jgi:exodeoxyribonuclease-3
MLDPEKRENQLHVCTVNVNGIRAAHKKGLFSWLNKRQPDVVCLQEIRAKEHQLHPDMFMPGNYHAYFYSAERPGYSGVALYSRSKPQRIIRGLGWDDFDAEARYLQADFRNLSIVSLYLPSGTSGPDRQAAKYDFMDRFEPFLMDMRRRRREVILCGDWNIAHRPIDLKNWRSNQKNSGFLPAERAWLDKVLNEFGFVDAFRAVNQQAEQYTWWSNRGQAWAKNVGWRIDYQVVTPGLRDRILDTEIYKDERFSDHAPLIISYRWS